MPKKLACIIVDPYVSAPIVCQGLAQSNIAPIAILCDKWCDPKWKASRLREAKFEKVIECYTPEQFNSLMDLLEPYTIIGCIYGREGKTIYEADKITERYFPQFKNTENSKARADKFYMNEACAQHGLLIGKQFRITSAELNPIQIKNISEILPVVVKPIQSAGSTGVSICQTLEEVQSAIARELGSSYHVGVVEELLVQQQLTGTEYLVDGACIEGKHAIGGVFRAKKMMLGATIVYRWLELINQWTDEAKTVVEYVSNALTAVGLRWGLAHTELFLTAKGPCLIEINSRISGVYGYMNKMAKLAYGINQVELLAQGLLEKNKIADIMTMQAPQSYSLLLCLQNWTPRVIGELNQSELKKFASYTGDYHINKLAGTMLGSPTSLLDTVAFVLLANSSHEQLLKDGNALLALEEKGCLF